MSDPDAAWNRRPSAGHGYWRRLGAALPMRTALFAVASVWILGCVWSFQEQSNFAASKGFVYPHLLPLVIDGFAVSMAGVAWAASLDARPAVPARLATLVAVAASSTSNGVWAWLRANHDVVTVVLGVAVPVAANLAFEVLLAELRRQVQRRRGLPPPVAVPYPRLIRFALAPWATFFAWRTMVLEITAMEHTIAPSAAALRGGRADDDAEVAALAAAPPGSATAWVSGVESGRPPAPEPSPPAAAPEPVPPAAVPEPAPTEPSPPAAAAPGPRPTGGPPAHPGPTPERPAAHASPDRPAAHPAPAPPGRDTAVPTAPVDAPTRPVPVVTTAERTPAPLPATARPAARPATALDTSSSTVTRPAPERPAPPVSMATATHAAPEWPSAHPAAEVAHRAPDAPPHPVPGLAAENPVATLAYAAAERAAAAATNGEIVHDSLLADQDHDQDHDQDEGDDDRDRPVDPRVEQLARQLATMEDADEVTGEMVSDLLRIDVAPRTGRRLLGQARELITRRARAHEAEQGLDPELSVIGGR